MHKYVIDENTLIGIADAIRYQYDSDDDIPVVDMAELIETIETGGGSLFSDNITVTSITVPSDTADELVIPHGHGKTPEYAILFFSGKHTSYQFLSMTSTNGYALVTGNGGAQTYKSFGSTARLTTDATNVYLPAFETYVKRSGTYYCIAISFT